MLKHFERHRFVSLWPKFLYFILSDEEVPRMDKTDMVDGPHKTSKIVYEIDEEEEDPKNERSLFWKHIKALEIKRFHHSKRNKKGIIAEVP